MAPLTTVAELQARLRWRDIAEETPLDGFRLFAVVPTDPSLPRIEFLFDDKVTLLQQLAFGPWHGHFEESSNERRNVRRAIATARTLISGARHLAVQRGAGGRNGYIGSSIHRRLEMPLTLSKGFQRLERLIFNAPAQQVSIDLTQYHRTKDGSFIEHAWRQRLKSVYAGTPVDVSMFD